MSLLTYHTCLEDQKDFLKLSPFASNSQWLELPMSRINFHGPKDVRAIEVLLHLFFVSNGQPL